MAERSAIMMKPHTFHIGDVFTPLEWGVFVVRRYQLVQKWMQGASIFDPTMGNGQLLQALVEVALQDGYALDELPKESIFGNELNAHYHQQALDIFDQKYGWAMASQFSQTDILKKTAHAFDIVLGNPPWLNFTDAPDWYKEELKIAFETWDLIDDKRSLLLGNSRMDVAALVIQCCMYHFLKSHGEAYFFVPLSLFLNEGAHQNFRKFRVLDVDYAPKELMDFQGLQVFENVQTRYGLVHLQRNHQWTGEVDFWSFEQGAWRCNRAKAIFGLQSPLSIQNLQVQKEGDVFEPIPLAKHSKPRQGLNTCGVNHLFMFHHYETIDEQNVQVSNSTIQVILPKKILKPLLVGANFTEEHLVPQKWILFPYDEDGKILQQEALQAMPLLWQYLCHHQNQLKNRKGVMIQSAIQKGYWWSLLGVGPYTMSPFKIVWLAFGQHEFRPKIVHGDWMVNQALQAYIPLQTQEEAQSIWQSLQQPFIQSYLQSLKMSGTQNWAQPGKMKHFFSFFEFQ